MTERYDPTDEFNEEKRSQSANTKAAPNTESTPIGNTVTTPAMKLFADGGPVDPLPASSDYITIPAPMPVTLINARDYEPICPPGTKYLSADGDTLRRLADRPGELRRWSWVHVNEPKSWDDIRQSAHFPLTLINPQLPAATPPHNCVFVDDKCRCGTIFSSPLAQIFDTVTVVSDQVEHPSHYTNLRGGVECIDIAQTFNFNRGNALKYLWRAGFKDDEITDLKKAVQYLQFEITRLESGE